MTAIGISSAIVLSNNDALGKNVLHVNVTAQQFAWTFSYPDAKDLTTATLMLPRDRSGRADLQSKDVIHSFWVPEFGQKQDACPGIHHDPASSRPNRIGTYPGHLHRAVRPRPRDDAHDRRRHEPGGVRQVDRGQTKAVTSPNAGQAGDGVFTNNGCGACHTLTAAEDGRQGRPRPRQARDVREAGEAARSPAFVRTSIVDPNAYIQPGYPKSVMPPTFGTSIPKQQLDALVTYLRPTGANDRDDASTSTDLTRRAGGGAVAPLLLGPGWIRAAWMFCLFGAIGFALVVVFRWWGGWHPILDMSDITLVSLLVARAARVPRRPRRLRLLGVLRARLADAPEDHSGHGRAAWRDYFRVNTDHKVIGVQYLVDDHLLLRHRAASSR